MGLGSTSVRLVSPAVNGENQAALLRPLESGVISAVAAQTYALDQAPGAVTHMPEHHPRRQIAITVWRGNDDMPA
jgi:hypothetical protein